MGRLYGHGVAGARLLEELAAVWAFGHWTRLPDDTRLTFALANAAFALAPRESRRQYKSPSGRTERVYPRIPRADRQAAGEAIRSTLGLLLYHIAMSIDKAETPEQQLREAFTAPFGLTLRIPTAPLQ
jgi:hypothetical protein